MSKSLLECIGITKKYAIDNKPFNALDNVSLAINQGEIIGLLGPNGAGKTTLSSVIATLHPPTAGDILFSGKSIYQNLINYRTVLGFCPQKPNFEKLLTVEENLRFAGRYFGLREPIIDERVDNLLKAFNLEKYARSKPDILSGGYKQRLLIARALVHNPKLLLLDEPTVGMDPHVRRKLWDTILQLKSQGITIVITTHYLDEAEVLSYRVCILDKGKIKYFDTPQNLKIIYSKTNLEDVFLYLMEDQHVE